MVITDTILRIWIRLPMLMLATNPKHLNTYLLTPVVHPDLWPSVRQMEAEVVAMTAGVDQVCR